MYSLHGIEVKRLTFRRGSEVSQEYLWFRYPTCHQIETIRSSIEAHSGVHVVVATYVEHVLEARSSFPFTFLRNHCYFTRPGLIARWLLEGETLGSVKAVYAQSPFALRCQLLARDTRGRAPRSVNVKLLEVDEVDRRQINWARMRSI